MESKQVRLDEDVYARIEDRKREDETFSEAIDRLTSDWSLADWSGWMDEAEAERHRELLDDLDEADRRDTEAVLDRLNVE